MQHFSPQFSQVNLYDVTEKETEKDRYECKQQSSRRSAAKSPPTHGRSSKSRPRRLPFTISVGTLTNEVIDTLLLLSDIHFWAAGESNSASQGRKKTGCFVNEEAPLPSCPGRENQRNYHRRPTSTNAENLLGQAKNATDRTQEAHFFPASYSRHPDVVRNRDNARYSEI